MAAAGCATYPNQYGYDPYYGNGPNYNNGYNNGYYGQPNSQAGNAVAGAAIGAATGAVAGAVLPGIKPGTGALAGAVLGGVLGASVNGRQYIAIPAAIAIMSTSTVSRTTIITRAAKQPLSRT